MAVPLLSAALVLFVASSSARTWYITPDGAGDAPTIQAGIDSTAVGDTVLVACGTYFEHDIRPAPGIVVQSENGDPTCAVVDAGNLGPALVCVDLALPVRIAGLTVTGGLGAPGPASGGGGLHCSRSTLFVSDCIFTGNSAEFGGGVGCYESDPSFERCEFLENSAISPAWAAGGGMYARDASPVLRNCSFSANTAFSIALPGDGGGLFSQNCTLQAIDCVFLGNSSGAGGGGFYSYDTDESILTGCFFQDNFSEAGGAAYFEQSYARMIGCTLLSNSADTGGALFTSAWSYPMIIGCLFAENEATTLSGGAITCWHSVPVFEDCTFVGNSTALDGGAMACSGVCGPTFENCEFLGNVAGRRGGALRGWYATRVELSGCTLADNSSVYEGAAVYHELSGPLVIDRSIIAFSTSGPPVICVNSTEVSVICSDVFGNADGNWVDCIAPMEGRYRNMAADPLFCRLDERLCTLYSSSPCAPANSSGCGLIGALPVGCGPIGVHAETWAGIKARYR